MNWFNQIKTPKIKSKLESSKNKTPSVALKQPAEVPQTDTPDPRGAEALKRDSQYWVKCSHCGEILLADVLKENAQVCMECGFHFRLGARERIALLCGSGFKEFDTNITSTDPLQFVDTKPYKTRLMAMQKAAACNDAIVTGVGQVGAIKACLAVFDFKFMGGSMGVVVGEKIVRAFEYANKHRLPLVMVTASGGARMQEGVLSLLQMAKVLAVLNAHRDAGLPYVVVLTDPTTGGVAASFAMQGDVTLAEPKALIGFAGPRVISQTIKQQLPDGFQRAEFLLEHGFVDQIVERKDLPTKLESLLGLLGGGAALCGVSKKNTNTKKARASVRVKSNGKTRLRKATR